MEIVRWFKRKRWANRDRTRPRCRECGAPMPPSGANQRSGVCKSCRRASERAKGGFPAYGFPGAPGPARLGRELPTGTVAAGAQGLQCSVCGEVLEHLGDPRNAFGSGASVLGSEAAFDALDQWRGLVCIPCRRVYCLGCLGYDGLRPKPCPTCGAEPVPAQQQYLSRIGAL
jgi:hypothetical protein